MLDSDGWRYWYPARTADGLQSPGNIIFICYCFEVQSVCYALTAAAALTLEDQQAAYDILYRCTLCEGAILW